MPTLILDFFPPDIMPENGYVVKYRHKGKTAYTTLTPNPERIPIVIPNLDAGVDYEGTIRSDCGYDSPEIPWFAIAGPTTTVTAINMVAEPAETAGTYKVNIDLVLSGNADVAMSFKTNFNYQLTAGDTPKAMELIISIPAGQSMATVSVTLPDTGVTTTPILEPACISAVVPYEKRDSAGLFTCN